MKRSILSFAGHISRGTSKSWRTFIADVIYGILASDSCILSRFADVLREDILKVTPLSAWPASWLGTFLSRQPTIT
ncbi:MAG: hypothetical protein ACOX63_04130 [Christensenellales bacterium]